MVLAVPVHFVALFVATLVASEELMRPQARSPLEMFLDKFCKV